MLASKLSLLMPTPKFSYLKTFLLGLGFFGVSVIWGIYNAFVPLFLENKFGLSPVWIGFFLTLDNVAALFVQPPVGTWSDRLRTPIGRRMPFILVGAPISALAFGVIPVAAVLPLFVACTSTLMLSMSLWRTPVVALMPDITPSKYRSQANSIITLMGGLGAIAAYLGGGQLFKINAAYPFWLGSALVIVASALLLIFIREPKIVEEPEAQPDLIESVKLLFKEREKSALYFLLALFCWTVGYTAIEAFWTLYATNHLRIDGGDATRLLGQHAVMIVIFALPCGYLAAKIKRRTLITGGLWLTAGLLATIHFLPIATLNTPLFTLPILGVVPIIGALLMVAGISWALITIHALPMIVDMTTAARLGTYTGLYYLFSTGAAIVGPNINGWVVQLSGRNYNTVLLFAPVWMIIASVLLFKVKRGEVEILNENLLSTKNTKGA